MEVDRRGRSEAPPEVRCEGRSELCFQMGHPSSDWTSGAADRRGILKIMFFASIGASCCNVRPHPRSGHFTVQGKASASGSTHHTRSVVFRRGCVEGGPVTSRVARGAYPEPSGPTAEFFPVGEVRAARRILLKEHLLRAVGPHRQMDHRILLGCEGMCGDQRMRQNISECPRRGRGSGCRAVLGSAAAHPVAGLTGPLDRRPL